MSKLTKIIHFKDGNTYKVQVIKDINDYRGFYVKFADGTYCKAGFNQSAVADVNEIVDSGYLNGFLLEYGSHRVEHLYNKLLKKLPLDKYEKEAFYEYINLRKPIEKSFGVYFDFREVLFKRPGIQFWTLEEKFNPKEKEIYREYDVIADKTAW